MISRRTFLRVSLAWPFVGSFSGPDYLLRAEETKNAQREEMLTKGRPTTVESLADAIVMKHENVFFLARPDGNVPLQDGHGFGLYYHDCRYLNGYELRIDGAMAADLSATAAAGSIGVFTLTNPKITMPDGTALEKEEIGVTWRRLIDSDTPALRDRLTFRSFTLRPVEFRISLTFQAAFEDVFMIRGLVSKRYGDLHAPVWNDGALTFGYDGKDGIYRAVTIQASPSPQRTHDTKAEFQITLGPRESRRLEVSLILTEEKEHRAVRQSGDPPNIGRLESEHEQEMREWAAHVTEVSSNGSSLDQIMERSFGACGCCGRTSAGKLSSPRACRGLSRCSGATV